MPDECNDKNCYKHGILKVRGGTLSGRVVSTKAKYTAIIERYGVKFLPKYGRWAKERSHISAHNPTCLNAKVGDNVKIGETRKISKTKAWSIIEILRK